MARPSVQLSVCPRVCLQHPEPQRLRCACWAGGGCFWHLLLPLPHAPFLSDNWLDCLGAECAGPKDLALQGRSLKRKTAPHPRSRRAWLGRGHGKRSQSWGPGSPRDSPAAPCGISSSKRSPNLATTAPHGPPLQKGVILISQTRHRAGKGACPRPPSQPGQTQNWSITPQGKPRGTPSLLSPYRLAPEGGSPTSPSLLSLSR